MFLTLIFSLKLSALLFCVQGETTINNFLARLNIPTVSPVTFKRHEREVGSVFEAIANESCNEALFEEKKKYMKII